jgi:glycosidase
VRKPNDRERRVQRLVVLFQVTYLGAPMVYYGDEAGMWGGDDPCDRMPMVWDDLAYEPQATDPAGRPRPADDVAFDRELHAYYRAAIAMRREQAILRRGSFEPASSDDEAKVFAFRRSLAGRNAYVVFNRGEASRSYAWRMPDDASKARVVFATDPEVRVDDSESGGSHVVLPALSGAVLLE